MKLQKYLGGKVTKKQILIIIGLIGVLVLNNSGFNYVNWNPTLGGWLKKLVLILFAFVFFFTKVDKRTCFFRKEIYALMLLPLLSGINSFVYFNQGPYDSFMALSGCFMWLLYFLLHKYNVSEASVLRIFMLAALFVVTVQIVQQFTYPKALFGVANPNDLEQGITEIAEQRNGIWRFRMHQNAYYTAPILFAACGWFRQRYDRSLIPLIALMLVSVYLTLTRQVMASCILTLFVSFFIGRKMKMSSIILVVVLALGLYFSYDALFSSLAEKTKEDSTEDNIRVFAANYFWNESIKSPFTFLFGYGFPNSPEFNMVSQQLTQVYHFFTADVGFIGQIYEEGIIYVLSFYLLAFRIFFKLRRYVPEYVRLFVIFTVAMSSMIFPLKGGPVLIILWSLLLYVCDLHISHSPLALKSTQNERNKF